MMRSKMMRGAAGYNPPTGQELFTETNTWTCPDDVISVNVLCIGPGGPGESDSTPSGGKGGHLRWKNNIPVVPGTTYDVVITGSGLSNYFIDPGIVSAAGYVGGVNSGTGSSPGDGGPGADYLGDSYGGGGGGAGGYGVFDTEPGGDGGDGQPSTIGEDGTGSSGGGGGGGATSGGSGGGVGPWGAGTAGDGGASFGQDGTAGSGGLDQKYGGGGGGSDTSADPGEAGCVRIIWGKGRSFPNRNTDDQFDVPEVTVAAAAERAAVDSDGNVSWDISGEDVAAGDVGFLFFCADTTAPAAPEFPGWTKRWSSGNTDPSAAMYTRNMDGTETTIVGNVDANTLTQVYGYMGLRNAAEYDIPSLTGGGNDHTQNCSINIGASIGGAGIPPRAVHPAHTFVIAVSFLDDDEATPTPPAGYTSQIAVNTGTGVANTGASLGVATLANDLSHWSNPGSFGGGGNDFNFAGTIKIKRLTA